VRLCVEGVLAPGAFATMLRRSCEIAALVSLIVVINAWNAIGVRTRTWVPGSYQP
jgi:hypothetical protein